MEWEIDNKGDGGREGKQVANDLKRSSHYALGPAARWV
jgi:hypothetical protein